MISNRDPVGMVALALSLLATISVLRLGVLGDVPISEASEPEAHSRTACYTCHNLSSNDAESVGGSADHNESCLKCHSNQAFEATVSPAFHKDATRLCLDCHHFHRTNIVTAGDSEFAMSLCSEGLSQHCDNCHTEGRDLSNLIPGHLEASAFYHGESELLATLSPSEACLACHSSVASYSGSIEADNAPQFSEHASHAFGVSFSPHAESDAFELQYPQDPEVQLIDDRIECQTCHRLTSGNSDLLAVAQTEGNLCNSCHVRPSSSTQMAVIP